jgi:hypothetical protein
MTKFWIDGNGLILKASSDDGVAPEGAASSITDPAPESGKQQWNGTSWIWPEAVSLDKLRKKRNRLLAETDWWASSDLNISDQQKSYRQALRDLPATSADIENPIWPEKP